MWTRAELKANAKQVLKGNYWKALLVSLVIAFASGSGGSGGRSQNNDSTPLFNPRELLIVGGAVVFVFLLAIAFRIFVGYALEVGGRRYFLKSAQYEDNTKCFSFSFIGENYKGIIPAMLLRSVYTILWFLLFIIPGIVKAYAYSMVPYILAENPNTGAKRAIELSNQMTKGHKFNIFVLDLSFIGWYLLGVLALGIGVFFVLPYEFATHAELYIALRRNCFDSNTYSNNQI